MAGLKWQQEAGGRMLVTTRRGFLVLIALLSLTGVRGDCGVRYHEAAQGDFRLFYRLVKDTRLSSTLIDYRVEVFATNLGEDARDVALTLASDSDRVFVYSPRVVIGELSAGETTTSPRTLRLRYQRDGAFPLESLEWSVSSAAGSVVGVDGGHLASSDLQASIEVPPGALPVETIVTIAPAVRELPASLGWAITPAYAMGPEGQTFDLPVTVELEYDPAVIPAHRSEAELVLAMEFGGVWALLPNSIVDASSRTVSAAVDHFSGFAVVLPSSPLRWPLGDIAGTRFNQDFSCFDCNASIPNQFHTGIDAANASTTVVRPAAAGSVAHVTSNEKLGNTVILDHGGFCTVYGHLKDPPTFEKDHLLDPDIPGRDVVGEVGDSGDAEGAPHLHFEVWSDCTFGDYGGYESGRHPDQAGWEDPWRRMTGFLLDPTRIVEVAAGTVFAHGPSAQPLNTPSFRPFRGRSLDRPVRLVAFARHGGFLRVHLPCGTADPARSDTSVPCSTWVPESRTTPITNGQALEVIVSGNAALIRDQAGGTGSVGILARAWRGQQFTVLQGPRRDTRNPQCESFEWYEIDYADHTGEHTGWICGDLVRLSQANSQPSEPSGSSRDPELFGWSAFWSRARVLRSDSFDGATFDAGGYRQLCGSVSLGDQAGGSLFLRRPDPRPRCGGVQGLGFDQGHSGNLLMTAEYRFFVPPEGSSYGLTVTNRAGTDGLVFSVATVDVPELGGVRTLFVLADEHFAWTGDPVAIGFTDSQVEGEPAVLELVLSDAGNVLVPTARVVMNGGIRVPLLRLFPRPDAGSLNRFEAHFAGIGAGPIRAASVRPPVPPYDASVLSFRASSPSIGSFFDDFSDGSVAILPTSAIVCDPSPCVESSGALRLREGDGASTRSRFGRLFTEDVATLGIPIVAGGGDAVVEAAVRLNAPGDGSFFALGLVNPGFSLQEATVIGLNSAGGVQYLSVNDAQGRILASEDLSSVPPGGVVVLRLAVDDDAGLVIASYSLDFGSSFRPAGTWDLFVSHGEIFDGPVAANVFLQAGRSGN